MVTYSETHQTSCHQDNKLCLIILAANSTPAPWYLQKNRCSHPHRFSFKWHRVAPAVLHLCSHQCKPSARPLLLLCTIDNWSSSQLSITVILQQARSIVDHQGGHATILLRPPAWNAAAGPPPYNNSCSGNTSNGHPHPLPKSQAYRQ